MKPKKGGKEHKPQRKKGAALEKTTPDLSAPVVGRVVPFPVGVEDVWVVGVDQILQVPHGTTFK